MTQPSAPPHHVLFLLDSLRGWGGGEGALLRLTHELHRAGLRCSVATFDLHPSLNLAEFPCPVHVFPFRLRGGLGLPPLLARLRSLILREQIDLVHTMFEASDIAGALAATLARVPVIISSRRDLGIRRRWFHTPVYRALGSLFDQVQTVSGSVRDFAIRHDHSSPARTITIPNGIDPDPPGWPAPHRSSSFIDPTGPRILSIGHLRPVKGFDDLIHAASLVTADFPSARFLIAGGPDDPLYTATLHHLAASLGLQDHILFLGPRDDIPGLLRISDAYCLLSHTEGMSNALLEAMAASLPCVVTAAGGNVEVIQHGRNGLLTPIRDSAAAAALLRILRDSRLRLELGRAARASILDRYTTARMASAILGQYRALCAHPAPVSLIRRLAS